MPSLNLLCCVYSRRINKPLSLDSSALIDMPPSVDIDVWALTMETFPSVPGSHVMNIYSKFQRNLTYTLYRDIASRRVCINGPTVSSFVCTKHRNVTDRQTDGQTDSAVAITARHALLYKHAMHAEWNVMRVYLSYRVVTCTVYCVRCVYLMFCSQYCSCA